MARSIRKGPYVESKLLSRIQAMNESGTRKIVRTWSRRSMIVPEMVGHNLHVYNGKLFMPIFVTENMVGHRLGEFAPTRKFSGHAGDKRLRKR